MNGSGFQCKDGWDSRRVAGHPSATHLPITYFIWAYRYRVNEGRKQHGKLNIIKLKTGSYWLPSLLKQMNDDCNFILHIKKWLFKKTLLNPPYFHCYCMTMNVNDSFRNVKSVHVHTNIFCTIFSTKSTWATASCTGVVLSSLASASSSSEHNSSCSRATCFSWMASPWKNIGLFIL